MDLAKISLKDLACYIYETLKNNKIDAILVGGACVTIYSKNQYQSYDLDFVTYEDIKQIEKVLQKIRSVLYSQGLSVYYRFCQSTCCNWKCSHT